MFFPPFSPTKATLSSRRRFVQGLAAGGVLASASPWLQAAQLLAPRSALPGTPELRGTEFSLEIAELPVNFTGKARVATAINGSIRGLLVFSAISDGTQS